MKYYLIVLNETVFEKMKMIAHFNDGQKPCKKHFKNMQRVPTSK